jgi:hypothetical protein
MADSRTSQTMIVDRLYQLGKSALFRQDPEEVHERAM